MAHTVIDRRLNGKGRSSPNRQRFIRRVGEQVQDAVKEAIREGKIKDLSTGSDKKVSIPVRDLKEPTFSHGEGGISDRVLPGNKHFSQGDRLRRPSKSGGNGSGQGGPGDPYEEEFVFQLTKEEFLDIFFEGLALPDLIKKNLTSREEMSIQRAGFGKEGNPSTLNIPRSMKQSKTRRVALAANKKRKLRELENELASLQAQLEQTDDEELKLALTMQIDVIIAEIDALKLQIKAIPYVDDVDLRYNRWEKKPQPVTKAVMFCIMDVSGSMGEWEKEMAKSFFILLYLFLTREYTHVDIVFIRHHTTAKEVEEEEFFYSKESGGTVVSSALDLTYNILTNRYPYEEWNAYVCQASDGDNFSHDMAVVEDLLTHKILPLIQYFAYVELYNVELYGDWHVSESGTELWSTYEKIRKLTGPKFNMQRIKRAEDIYPVFRGLFEAST